jgi:hypothetical protein
MRTTTVTIQRPEGTLYASGVRVQVDQMTFKEVMDHMDVTRMHGHDGFKVYTLDWIPPLLIHRDDVLIDERYTDPDTITPANPTGSLFKYRVVSRPKDYDWDHQEMVVEVVVGG